MESLEIVLRSGGIADRFTAEERLRLAERKNARCLELLSRITPAEVLPGAA